MGVAAPIATAALGAFAMTPETGLGATNASNLRTLYP